MNKHTPGNWYVNGGDDVWIGERICVYVGDENDARLIAAAPDLLEALELFRRLLDEDGEVSPWAIKQIVGEAIAKATGDKHD